MIVTTTATATTTASPRRTQRTRRTARARVDAVLSVFSVFSVVMQFAVAPSLQSQATPSPQTQLIVLGTGNPNADPERSGPALAVVRGEKSYLIDAGPGIVRRAAAAARTHDIAALTPPNLKVLFITHLHSDHTIGLPDVILSAWVLERTTPLEVYGPPGTKAMVDHLLAAYNADIRNRLDGLEPANENGYKVNVHEITGSGQIFDDGNIRVRAFAVPHGDWDVSYGYRFDSPERSIVVSGDTRASDAVVTLPPFSS